MIDVEIHGTGGRTPKSRTVLLENTREALAGTSYYGELTLVDTGSAVFSFDQVETMPFARIYAPPEILPSVIDDIKTKLSHLFATLEGIQVIRVNTRNGQ